MDERPRSWDNNPGAYCSSSTTTRSDCSSGGGGALPMIAVKQEPIEEMEGKSDAIIDWRQRALEAEKALQEKQNEIYEWIESSGKADNQRLEAEEQLEIVRAESEKKLEEAETIVKERLWNEWYEKHQTAVKKSIENVKAAREAMMERDEMKEELERARESIAKGTSTSSEIERLRNVIIDLNEKQRGLQLAISSVNEIKAKLESSELARINLELKMDDSERQRVESMSSTSVRLVDLEFAKKEADEQLRVASLEIQRLTSALAETKEQLTKATNDPIRVEYDALLSKHDQLSKDFLLLQQKSGEAELKVRNDCLIMMKEMKKKNEDLEDRNQKLAKRLEERPSTSSPDGPHSSSHPSFSSSHRGGPHGAKNDRARLQERLTQLQNRLAKTNGELLQLRRSYESMEKDRDDLRATLRMRTEIENDAPKEIKSLQYRLAQTEEVIRNMQQSMIAAEEKREKEAREAEGRRKKEEEERRVEMEEKEMKKRDQLYVELHEERKKFAKAEAESEELRRVNDFLVNTKSGKLQSDLAEAQATIDKLKRELAAKEATTLSSDTIDEGESSRKKARMVEPAAAAAASVAPVVHPPMPSPPPFRLRANAASPAAAAAPTAAATKWKTARFQPLQQQETRSDSFKHTQKHKNAIPKIRKFK